MSASISRRLIFWLAVPLMLLALCSALVHYLNSVAPGYISSDRRLVATADQFERQAGTRTSQALPAGARFALRDASGALLSGDAALDLRAHADESQLFANANVGGHALRTLTRRVNSPRGPAYLIVAEAAPPAEPAARYGLMSTLLWDFVQLDITLVLVWLGIQLGLRPIRKLRDEIAERSPHDLRPIADGAIPREIAPLVVTLNRLFDTLRSAAQSQQQFIANTAHQLRTPITGMQAQLEVLAAEAAAQPIKPRIETLQEGIRQLGHAANQLLSLARADPAANVAAKNQPVDLATLAQDVVARYVDRAVQNNIDLGIEAQSAVLRADPSLLDDLLSNLLDNAIKYTPPGGSVTASAGVRASKPYLSVEDTGVGIPEADRQRVKQRFYRLPNAPGHGSGLGLAIVEEIAQLYGGTVQIGCGADGRGTRIVVQFA